jgi:hypothetical protein
MAFDSCTVAMSTERLLARAAAGQHDSHAAVCEEVGRVAHQTVQDLQASRQITSYHITSDHVTSHYVTSPSHHITPCHQMSDGCLTELLRSCSVVGSNLSGTQHLLATAAAEHVIQHDCSAATILCTTGNSRISLPAWYYVISVCHLVSAIKHTRAVWCRLENVAVLYRGSFDKAGITLVFCSPISKTPNPKYRPIPEQCGCHLQQWRVWFGPPSFPGSP